MELAARNIKTGYFAELPGMKSGHFGELLDGKRYVDPAAARKLEKLLDISAEYWMRIPVYHDLFQQRARELEAA